MTGFDVRVFVDMLRQLARYPTSISPWATSTPPRCASSSSNGRSNLRPGKASGESDQNVSGTMEGGSSTVRAEPLACVAELSLERNVMRRWSTVPDGRSDPVRQRIDDANHRRRARVIVIAKDSQPRGASPDRADSDRSAGPRPRPLHVRLRSPASYVPFLAGWHPRTRGKLPGASVRDPFKTRDGERS